MKRVQLSINVDDLLYEVFLEHQLIDFYNEELNREQELRDYIRGSSDTLNLALKRLILI